MDDRFHECIYRLSGRTVLTDTLRPLHKKVQRYRKISIQDSSRTEASIMEHKAIFEAIMSGDAEQAEIETCIHIHNAKESMIARFQHNG